MVAKPKAGRRRKPTRPNPKGPTPKPRGDAPRIDESQITLERTPGGPDSGGGPGGEAWHIYVAGESAGRVYINIIDEAPFGAHASIQIYLNGPSQSRGVGRVGYRRACEASAYDVIYAHMRKSNVASVKAAEGAGFVDATPAGATQKVMVWRRPKT